MRLLRQRLILSYRSLQPQATLQQSNRQDNQDVLPRSNLIGIVPDIQTCGTHGRENLVNATIISNAEEVGWLVGCLTSQQHASVSQGRICSDNFTCCHTEIEVADPTFYLTQSQYTDTGPTSPSADPITPGAWQGSHWSANFEVTGMTRPRKNPGASGIRTRDLPLSRRTPYH